MATTLINGDISVFSLDPENDASFADYLGLIQNVQLSASPELVNAKPITRVYEQNQPAKNAWAISAPIMSIKSGSVKVSTLDVSAFTLFGTDFKAYLKSGQLVVGWNNQDSTGAADYFRSVQFAGGKSLSFRGQVMVPPNAAAGSQLIQAKAFSTTPADLSGTVSITINGVAITAAMTLAKWDQAYELDGLQVMNVEFSANAPDSGTYPAAPTGTTTLLERALNSINAMGIRFTSHPSEGMALEGTAFLQQATIEIPESGLIKVGYEWQGVGAPTVTMN